MCNPAVLAYGQRQLGERDVRGKRVIDVGARNVNGSLRPHAEQFGPAGYHGVDIEAGRRGRRGLPGRAPRRALRRRESFDVVICTEVLEHVRDWRAVISNLKQLVAPGGVLLITTRSIGFPYHAFPHDFWRYENDDMRAIFSDFDVENVEDDPGPPGRVHDRPPPPDLRRAGPRRLRALLDGPGRPLPRSRHGRGAVVHDPVAGPAAGGQVPPGPGEGRAARPSLNAASAGRRSAFARIDAVRSEGYRASRRRGAVRMTQRRGSRGWRRVVALTVGAAAGFGGLAVAARRRRGRWACRRSRSPTPRSTRGTPATGSSG